MNLSEQRALLFDNVLTFPDTDAQDRLSRLVGLDDKIARLAGVLGIVINPAGLKRWQAKHHPGAGGIISLVTGRPPLVILAGDVGSGKTELAETIGDLVARQERLDIQLLPLSLASRGQGRVGEMTQLISSAFDFTAAEAAKVKGTSGSSRGGVILLVDEADALAQSRELDQMHHEDRAGVNAFIRGVDRLGRLNGPAAVIMCTNRLGALDPAVKRRAADILIFERPNADQRRAVLDPQLTALGFSRADIEKIVTATGESTAHKLGFTFSDLVQRLLPAIVLDAYPGRAVAAARAIEIARSVQPTPPFNDRT